MRLEKRELMLNTGQKAIYEYDPESDMLEVIFRQAEATGAIQLTESIILRFDWEKSEPLSLSFVSISKLMQPAEYGEIHFQLLTDDWPDEVQDKVLAMLRESPLTEFLSLGGYAPAHSQQIVPSATIKQPHLALLAA